MSEEITIDFWFYLYNAAKNFEFSLQMNLNITLKLNQLNTDIVDIKCRQLIDFNDTSLGEVSKGLYLLSETRSQIWTYIRCSLSNTVLDFNLISNNLVSNQSVVFAKESYSSNKFTIKVKDYKGYAYIRELRFFKFFLDKAIDIRYMNTFDNLNLIGYVKFDFFKGKQVVNEENYNGDVILPEAVNYSEQLLPNTIPNIPICEEYDMTFYNNTCVNSK